MAGFQAPLSPFSDSQGGAGLSLFSRACAGTRGSRLAARVVLLHGRDRSGDASREPPLCAVFRPSRRTRRPRMSRVGCPGQVGLSMGPRRHWALPSSAPRAARALGRPRLRADIWIAEWDRVPRRDTGSPAQTDTQGPRNRTNDRLNVSHSPQLAKGRTGIDPVRRPTGRAFLADGRSLPHPLVRPPRRAHPVPGAARSGGTPEFTTI